MALDPLGFLRRAETELAAMPEDGRPVAERVSEAAERAREPLEGRSLPTIVANARRLRDMTDEAVAALRAANVPPVLFRRGGSMARVRQDEEARPLVDRLGESELRWRLARVANFVRKTKDGEVDVPPPLEVVRDVLALGEWPLPPLGAVVETPCLRPDGSVVDVPGYDAATRLLYRPRPDLTVPSVPTAPTSKQRRDALALLNDALLDFPFADQASRAAAFGLMLTPVIRPAISGQVPLAVLDAPAAGTGKGLLASLCALVGTGRPAAVLPAPTREEEWAKVLFSKLLDGATFVLLDEVRELSSPALASMLTASQVEGRVLGRSEMARVPNRATWVAAGNNLRLAGDLGRRAYWCRLDAKTARPWQRSGFRHPDLIGWAEQRRAELLGALLTLARAWWAEGQPIASTPPIGGFQDWARAVGGILALAGVDGFLENLAALYERADQDGAAWEPFLLAWYCTYGEQPQPVSELAREVERGSPLRDALPDDLGESLGTRGFKPRLGRALGAREGRRFGDYGARVERVSTDSRSGVARWRVVADDPQSLQRLQRSHSPDSARAETSSEPGRAAFSSATPCISASANRR